MPYRDQDHGGGAGSRARVLNIRHLPPIGTWPDDVKRVDRRSPWGNPFRIGFPIAHGMRDRIEPGDLIWVAAASREDALTAFRAYATERLQREPDWLDPLHGRRLACWCAPEPCHADILVEMGA